MGSCSSCGNTEFTIGYYSYLGDGRHKYAKTCLECGFRTYPQEKCTTDPDSKKFESADGASHYIVHTCKKCKGDVRQGTEPHKFGEVSYSKNNGSVHNFSKKCNKCKHTASGTEDHDFGSPTVSGGSVIKTCRKCSYSKTIGPYGTFNWDSPKVKGEKFVLTANEWNNMVKYINSKRSLKGLRSITATAVSGSNLTAALYNTIVDALNEMGASSVPPRVTGGTPSQPNSLVSAECLNALVTSLNSVTN